mmetsp:Transcript_27787/g.42046  ORF Transcript_27787/g.42046 Transcript_27787/m.42046 type:complete len:151 (-) Transcript_27787:67-519(-)
MTISKRKTKKNEIENEVKTKNVFANHAAGDTAIHQKESNEETATPRKNGVTNFGRFFLFLGLPFLVGMLGFYAAYLLSLFYPGRQVNFDNDFILPFLLTLAMVLVIGFQTGGFTGKKPKALVSWPKVRRKKKIIHKTVIVDDEVFDNKED